MIVFASPGRRSRVHVKLPKLFARFLAQRDGAVALEFAIISIPFFLIVLATLQTAIAYMAEQELETAVEESSRLILTNQGSNYTQSQFTNAVCAKAVVLFNCSGLMVDVRNYGTGTSFSSAITSAPTLTYDSKGNVTNTWQFSPGSPGSIVVVRVMYQWPIFLKPFGFNLSNLPNGDRLIMATAVFRNEPS